MRKSSFLTELEARDNDDGTRTLTTPFIYSVGWLNSGLELSVPKGFRFNGASVPKWLHSYIHPWHPSVAKGACIHDFMYAQQHPRWLADRVLFEAMGVLRAPIVDRALVYAAVRLFGWMAYRDARKDGKAEVVDAAEVITEAKEAVSD